MILVLHICTDAHHHIHLLSDLLPFRLQHLLLLIGVIDDVLPPDQQLALHRLGKTKQILSISRLSAFPKAAVRLESDRNVNLQKTDDVQVRMKK